jgi:hypothetical protein
MKNVLSGLKERFCFMSRQLDDRIMINLKNKYIQSPFWGFRERIISSYSAFLLMFIVMRYDPGYPKYFVSTFCLLLFMYAIYFWRVFFILKKEDVNSDEPCFFIKPAAALRKWLFLISLLAMIYPWVSPFGMPSLLPCELLEKIAPLTFYDIILSGSLAVFGVEIFRMFTSSWSERKHYAVVIVCAFLILIFIANHSHRPLRLLICA